MDYKTRITNIENLIERQRYLDGCTFRVKVVDVEKDTIEVHFESMTRRQLKQLRNHLADIECSHIRPIVKNLIEEKDPIKQHRRRVRK